MLKQLATLLLALCLLGLNACAITPGEAFMSYVDASDGYEFLYPNGWIPVEVSRGPDVVMRDLIERTENLSVIISQVPPDRTLADIGTPMDVGQRLAKQAISSTEGDRQAELIRAEERQVDGKQYYLLEYTVQLPNSRRHNLASVAVSRGKLFSFNLSTTEARWSRVADLFEQSARSFSVY